MAFESGGLTDLKDHLPGIRGPAVHDGVPDGKSGDLMLPVCFERIEKRANSSKKERDVRFHDALEIVKASLVRNGMKGRVSEALCVASTVVCIEELLSALRKDGKPGTQPLGERSSVLLADMCALTAYALGDSSPAVILAKWKHILLVLNEALWYNMSNELFCRSYCSCVAAVLALLDSSSWKMPEALETYQKVLALAIDERERVQQRARDALTALLTGPRGRLIQQRTSKSASTFLVSVLRGQDAAQALAAVSLGSEVAGKLSPRDAFTTAQEALKVAGKRTPVLSTAAWELIPKVILDVEDGPVDEDGDREVTCTLSSSGAKAIAKMAAATAAPNSDEPGAVAAYAEALAAAVTAMTSARERDGDLMGSVCKLILSALDGAMNSAEDRNRLLASLEQIVLSEPDHGSRQVLSALESLLAEKYKPYWDHCLQPLASFFALNGETPGVLREKLIGTMERVILLRNGVKDAELKEALDVLPIALLGGGGASVVLEAAQIQLDTSRQTVRNSWLLPLMRDHIQKSQLELYVRHMAPMERSLVTRAQKEEAEGSVVAAKVTRILASQVRGTLCGFCNRPTDANKHMLGVTKLFKAALTNSTTNTDVCDLTLRALRNLAKSMEGETDLSTFVRALRELMPVLLSASQTAPPERREEFLSTVKTCLIASRNKGMTTSFLRVTLKKILSAASTGKNKSDAHACADIALAIASSHVLDEGNDIVNFLYRTFVPVLMDPSDPTLQKKSYKIVGELIRSGMLAMPDDFVMSLVKATDSTAMGSKASRVSCITSGLEILNGEGLQKAASEFLVELVLYTRDSSTKTRESAVHALSAIATRFRTSFVSGIDQDQVGLRSFLVLLLSGFAGHSPAMLSASLTVTARFIFQFRMEASVSPPLAHDVDSLFADLASVEGAPGPVTLLLRHESREVVRAALGTIKVACVALDAPRLESLFKAVLPPLLAIAWDSKNDLRLRVKVILERLYRRCGREALEGEFPAEHAKLLRSVRKQVERRAKKKSRSRQKHHTAFDEALEGSEGEEYAQSELGTKTALTSVGSGAMTMNRSLATTRRSKSMKLSRADSRMTRMTRMTASTAGVRKQHAKEFDSRLVLKDGGDLLEGNVATMLTERELGHKRGKGRRDELDLDSDGEEDGGGGGGYVVGEDGRPIFRESESESEAAEAGSNGDENSDGDLRPRKRLRGPGGSDAMKRRKRKAMKGASLGEEFRGKRGRGDVKRRSRPDPYAYVPLGPSAFEAVGKKGKRSDALLRKVAMAGKMGAEKGHKQLKASLKRRR